MKHASAERPTSTRPQKSPKCGVIALLRPTSTRPAGLQALGPDSVVETETEHRHMFYFSRGPILAGVSWTLICGWSPRRNAPTDFDVLAHRGRASR